MNPEINVFNKSQSVEDEKICSLLAHILDENLPEAKSKIWHRHPVWFLKGNPIVGYNRLKAGIRLMFWSGADFDETDLKPGTGKFKDASIFFQNVDQINIENLKRWIDKSKVIQWDYKNIYKNKGKLVRFRDQL